jgi:Ca2+-transporting ATPase
MIKNHCLNLNEKQTVANEGYRVIAYAIKEMRTLPETLNVEEIESSLTFIGFAGMIDPERSKKAVSACIQAEHPCNDYR